MRADMFPPESKYNCATMFMFCIDGRHMLSYSLVSLIPYLVTYCPRCPEVSYKSR